MCELSAGALGKGGDAMRVLIVEDETLIRMLVLDLLEDAGFECREAADAAGALATLEQTNWGPDLLLTDYNLGPGPNGADLAATIRGRLPQLPVIYVTGNPECLASVGAHAQGRVLAKPFAGTDLVAAVQDAGEAALGQLAPVLLTAGTRSRLDPALQA